MKAALHCAIVIIGSGSGIGAATVRRLAGPGVGILVHARENVEGVAQVAGELEVLGARTQQLCPDLADPRSASAVIDRAGSRKRIGEPDEVAAIIAFLASPDANYVIAPALLELRPLNHRFHRIETRGEMPCGKA